jgi:hypothetical protein
VGESAAAQSASRQHTPPRAAVRADKSSHALLVFDAEAYCLERLRSLIQQT